MAIFNSYVSLPEGNLVSIRNVVELPLSYQIIEDGLLADLSHEAGDQSNAPLRHRTLIYCIENQQRKRFHTSTRVHPTMMMI